MLALTFAVGLVFPVGCAPGSGPGGRAAPSGAGGPPFDPDSVPEAYARPTAALLWPFATRTIEVTPAGDLYNGDWRMALEPAADGVAAGPPRVIAYEQRWLPVAHWRRRSGDVRWDFEACALPAPAPGDSALLACVRVSATNEGNATREASLDAVLEPRRGQEPFVFFDAPDSARTVTWAARGVARAGGWIEGGATGTRARRVWRLAPGAGAGVRLALPAYPAPAARLDAWAHRVGSDPAARARRAWTDMLAPATRFDLGDPEVESALRAALVVLLACRERRGAEVVPIGNPFQYRDVWLRDGARAVAALAVANFTDESRRLARGLTLLEWQSGAFLSQPGQLDGTGQALWALGQAYLRPAPDPAAAAVAGAVRDGWRWCETQRALSRTAESGLPGLMPFGDPHDNEDVRAELVGNDAWSLAGYRWGARLLRAAGETALADSVERAREDYRATFLGALAACGSPDIPPSWQRQGLDWGNVAVAWPCGALPAGDARCAALARRLWARSGGAGFVTYRSPDSLSYYLGADLGTWALLAGERGAADSVLGALLRQRTASGGAAELFDRHTLDFGDNLPPHATGAAALVALVRNAIVFDDGDTLALTLGARARWWRGSRVERAPTRWGTLHLDFRSDGRSAAWHWTPVSVWTALRLPPGTRLAAAPAPPLRGVPGGDVVLAPPGAREVSVALAPPVSGR